MEALLLQDQAPLRATIDAGWEVLLRPIGPEDVDRVERALQRLSRESFRNRFSGSKSDRDLAEYLCHSQNELTWVALDPADAAFHGFGGASFWRDAADPSTAEVSFTVGDDWQRKGLACLLFSVLWTDGWETGIRHVTGLCRATHHAMLHWWSALGGSIAWEHGYAHLEFHLSPPETFIEQVGGDLHSSTVRYEIASGLRHWQEVLGHRSSE